MRAPSGLTITIEGAPKTGKTTVAAAVADILQRAGANVTITDANCGTGGKYLSYVIPGRPVNIYVAMTPKQPLTKES